MCNLRRWGVLPIAAVLAAGVGFAGEEASKIEFSGYLDTTYTYNINNPPNRKTQFRSYETTHNSFYLNQVHLGWSGAPTEGVEWVVGVDIGSDAAANTSGGIEPALNGDDFDIQEAYISYMPKGSKIGFKAGKFATYQGIELIDPRANPVVTRGFLYGFAEAVTHTGVVLMTKLSDKVSLNVGLINGWDTVIDDNEAKMVVVNVGLSLAEGHSLAISAYSGAEGAGNEDSPLSSLDITGSSTINKMLTLNYQVNFGHQRVIEAGDDTSWFGVTIQPVITFNDKFSLGLRVELLNDDDNARFEIDLFPMDGTADSRGTDFVNFSVAPSYKLSDNLTVRGEIRLDHAGENVFVDDEGKPSAEQTTVTFEAVLTF